MDEKKGFVEVDEQIRLYYEVLGSGPVIIIPNGFYFLDAIERYTQTHTIIIYDLRNRGLSDTVSEPEKLKSGILHDVEDLETLRKHFNLNSFALIAHSYVGLMAMLYASKYPSFVNRAVLIGATQPDASKTYPDELKNEDGVIGEAFARIREMQKERPADPVAACKQFWSALRRIYVYKEEFAEQIDFGRCELNNERSFMNYWTKYLMPSMQNIRLTANDLQQITIPVLVIHGNRDRSAPYGSGIDWATLLPNAKLATLKDVAHAPWTEDPERFHQLLREFLDGSWPDTSIEAPLLS